MAAAAAIVPEEGVVRQLRAVAALAPRTRKANLHAMIVLYRDAPLTEAALEAAQRAEIGFRPMTRQGVVAIQRVWAWVAALREAGRRA